MDEEVLQLMHSRGIPEENITRMISEKFDDTTLLGLTDELLSHHIPLLGDRVAIRKFIDDKNTKSRMSTIKRKELFSLLNRQLAEKTAEPTNKKSKRIRKMTRRIEIGWIHNGTQVRKRQGGGTRKVDVKRTSLKSDLIGIGKELFFPKGKSTKGKAKTCHFDLLDFKETPLASTVSVDDCYDVIKMGVFTCYLSTTTNDETSSSSESDIDTSNTVQFGPFDSSTDLEATLPMSSTPIQNVSLSTGYTHQQSDELPQLHIPITRIARTTMENASYDFRQPQPEFYEQPQTFVNIDSLQPSLNLVPSTEPSLTIASLETASRLSSYQTNAALNSNHTLTLSELATFGDNTGSFSPQILPTPPLADFKHTLHLHRSNVVNEMVAYFKTPDITDTPISFTFVNEIGSDVNGVSREAYTLFWKDFLSNNADGDRSRVPVTNSQWTSQEWESVGAILAKGFRDHQFFPLQLSPAFFCASVLGEKSISSDLLFESLMEYLPSYDEAIIRRAVKEDLQNKEDIEEMQDILNKLQCKSLPQQNEVKSVILTAAHRIFLQDPKYAMVCMSTVIKDKLGVYFPDFQSIKDLYESKIPTIRRILRLLSAEPTNQNEEKAYEYLKTYVKAQDSKGLRVLLRFLTGSDIVCINKIDVTFSNVRSPVAHTCGPMLEMPRTYMAYREFRNVMDNILSNESCWEFSIV